MAGIHIKKSHEGKLHQVLGIPEGKTIPVARLEKAKHATSAAERKEANFALNARQFKHK